MNRLLLISTALLGGLMPLAIDSALKGAVLLSMAALAALSMRRASAAARHLVWLVAVAALLVVPLLTIALPQWRVLPDWAASPVQTTAAVTEKALVPSPQAVESTAPPIRREQPAAAPATAPPLPPALPSAVPVASGSQVVTREASLPPEEVLGNAPAGWLGLGWLLGFLLLSLRLLASQVMLRRAARSCRTPDAVEDQRLVALFNEARGQLGVRPPVRLMIDPKRTIPLVWGVFRPRLMVPAETRGWSDSALRSVLLHELAHLKRRDTSVQWLAQIACALHWWNPLVWLAAWRLHVEREKACDDLVLASGVQPSSYAEHLLHVATRLSPARWSSACGLAMARKSSLEGRLVAVLSDRPNRRSVTRALVTTALLLGTGIAIPVAMLRAADDEWNSPKGAHIGSNDFSAFCIHDGKEAEFVIAYHGDFNSTGRSSSNAKARTWTDDVTLTVKKAGIALSLQRVQTSPGKLSLTTAPAEARDLGKPAPAPRDFGQKEYDLAKGRVFLLTDSGTVRQFDLPTPIVTDQESAKKLAALIAAILPQEREDLAPQHKDARALYEIWQRHARANGDIPGALIGELAAAVKVFIGYNPTWETVPKLNEILPRLDATRDWTPADAIALLNEVAAVQDSPLQTAVEKSTAATIRKGEALPKKFAGVAWGETQPNGLRAAWVLEPAAVEHRMGTALKARLLVQNTGNIPVMARVPTWHQGGVSARDAAGSEVEVFGIEWTTLARLVPVRLAPGECIEINAPGVGLGTDAGHGPWAGPRVGSNVLAKDGVELTLTHGPLVLDGSGVGMREDAPHLIGPGWWQAHIKSRLSRDLPPPADAAERQHLLDRAVRELFGTAPTAEETAAFTADQTAGAFDALVQRLAARADVAEFSASLPLAPVKFRVLPADPAADKTPRVVLGPGEYPLSETATLKIVGRPDGERYIYDTEIISKPSVELGIPVPEKIEVTGNWGTWAIVCRPGEGFFYVLHQGTARKIDYTNPRQIIDTPATDLPAGFRDEVKRQLDIAGVSVESQAGVFETSALPVETEGDAQPNRGAQLLPATEQQLKWGEPQNGLRAALVMHPVPDEPDAEDKNDIFLVVQNVSAAAIRLHASDAAPNPRQLIWREKGKLETVTETAQPIPADFQLQSREVAFFRMLLPSRTRNPGGRSTGSLIAESIRGDTDFDLTGKMEIENAPTGAWTGKLLSGEIKGGTTIPALPQPSPETAKEQGGPGADVKPVSKQLFNEDYAAFAVQSEKDVNFVLFYQGDLSSGISEFSSGTKWRFNGNVYLVDPAKTAVAGKNVNKRIIAVEYTSDEPTKLYLDGKAYALDARRVFVLGDAGEPFQLARSMALRSEDDLVKIGDFATNEMKRVRPAATPEPELKTTDGSAPVAPAPGPVQPVTDGSSSAQVLRADGQEPVVILTGRALTASPDSTSRWGAVTVDVATSDKTETIRYTWPEDAPGFFDLELGGRGVFRFDLSRGRAFFIHFEKMEFSADVFQVPAAVEVPAIASPETLTRAAAAVTAWYAATDDRARWESSRVVVPDREYKTGLPLDAAAGKIVWGEANDAGLRLGLGGLEVGALYRVGQLLPVTQYIRNDSTQTITFSPTQIFNEGVGGELVRVADGKKFPHKKGYPWQGFFHRVRLAPGHYIELGSGPMRTLMAEKDGSSPGGMDMMAHGFTVLPGDYTLQLTHGIGQFLGRPANFHFGDPRGAPGLGEWTGVLTSAAVPLRLVDEQVKTAKAGDSEAFGNRYNIGFEKGAIRLRHYQGYPGMSSRRQGSNDPWEEKSRDWKIPTADGEYVAAWAVGGQGLWVKDATGITRLIVKDVLTENGKWKMDQASGELGDMPAGVRAALQLPPLAALQPFDFKKLPNTSGAAKIEGEFFEMALSQGTVLKVPHKGSGFFIESGGIAYGPAQGNPVVELGLTDLLRAKLAETPNTAGLEMLRHMIADGRGTIRDCGFRLLADLKAPQAPFDYDAVFHAMIHASIEDEHGPKELTPEAHLGYARLHNLFHSTRLEWERTRPLLAAGRYQPGETPSEDPAIAWTAGPDGLSLGVSGLPAGTNLEIGKSVPVAIYLRNDNAAPVKLSVPAEHNPVMQISLTDAAGKTHRTIYRYSSPLTAYRHHELAPGSAVKVAAFDLEALATPDEATSAAYKEGKEHNPRLAVPAGSYDLHLEYRNYQESPVPRDAGSEWTGKATARPVPVKIAAKSPAKITPAMLSGFWSNGGLGREETVAVSFDREDRGPKTADVYIGSGSIGLITTIEMTGDATAASVKSRNTNVGRLVPGEDGTLVFEIAASADQPGRSVPIQQRPEEQPEGKTPAESDATSKVQPGQPLPKKLESAPWGPAVNGLRMTLVWPPSHGEAGLGNAEEFHLVVQNVSDAEIRLFAGPAAPNPRRLVLRKNGGILSALGDPRVMPGDWNLKPREVAFLRLFQVREKAPDGRPVDATIEEDIRAFPQYSMTAEMDIDEAPAGAWTGKLVTGESRGSLDVAPPRNENAQALYKTWMTAARKDGKIPGGVIGLLGVSVKTFIKNNPTWETRPGLEKLLPRFDATRDWSGEEAVSLLDELAALQDTPIEMALDQERLGIVQTGTPLPADLVNAPWGEALPNGLRHAWLLEPRAAEQRLGTALKARVLIHNSGKVAVVFRTRSWHQLGHQATDAKGVGIKTESTSWTTRGLLQAYRLEPGEFIELAAPGIGVGPVGNREDWQNKDTRVGTWIEAKAGDEVTMTTAPLPLSDWNEKPEADGEPRWWLDHIATRLSRHQPFPADKAARELMLYRVAMELFGTPVSLETNAAFVADSTPGALDALAERLLHRPGPEIHPSAGPLNSGPTTFRVLPADPNASK